ncbi:MAG: CRISPR system precrRNA processing endoribonuclease RAMP protein Cas6 [Ruminococcus sp.]|nr:CRISPR system precrRNA processing endoribonuclease RAMP protein Cas6 [Ruminococcus sp.]
MLYRAELSYKYTDLSALQSDPAVKIHGFLMDKIAPDLAEWLHQPQYHPYALSCLHEKEGVLRLRISALTDRACGLIDTLCGLEQISLCGCPRPIQLTHVTVNKPIQYPEAARCLSANKLRLTFETPAMYRSKGRFRNPPMPEKYFYSVLCKINTFEGLNLRWEDFLEGWDCCEVLDYSLSGHTHFLTGMAIPGMTGTMLLRIPQKNPHGDLLRTLLSYAVYSGLGAKTALGMGGFSITPV